MQHLGEVCMAQCSRGLFLQDKNHVKPRKEIQKRSFWRRFFSSFLSLLKEKRPPEAKKRGTDSHASDVGHWLGMTGQEANANNPSVMAFGHDTSLYTREVRISAPAGAGTDSHASDIGHWLGMTT